MKVNEKSDESRSLQAGGRSPRGVAVQIVLAILLGFASTGPMRAQVKIVGGYSAAEKFPGMFGGGYTGLGAEATMTLNRNPELPLSLAGSDNPLQTASLITEFLPNNSDQFFVAIKSFEITSPLCTSQQWIALHLPEGAASINPMFMSPNPGGLPDVYGFSTDADFKTSPVRWTVTDKDGLKVYAPAPFLELPDKASLRLSSAVETSGKEPGSVVPLFGGALKQPGSLDAPVMIDISLSIPIIILSSYLPPGFTNWTVSSVMPDGKAIVEGADQNFSYHFFLVDPGIVSGMPPSSHELKFPPPFQSLNTHITAAVSPFLGGYGVDLSMGQAVVVQGFTYNLDTDTFVPMTPTGDSTSAILGGAATPDGITWTGYVGKGMNPPGAAVWHDGPDSFIDLSPAKDFVTSQGLSVDSEGDVSGDACFSPLGACRPVVWSPRSTIPLKGDLTGSGRVTIGGVTASLQIAVGNVVPNTRQFIAGDVNLDGKMDLKDTTLILQAEVRGTDASGESPVDAVTFNGVEFFRSLLDDRIVNTKEDAQSVCPNDGPLVNHVLAQQAPNAKPCNGQRKNGQIRCINGTCANCHLFRALLPIDPEKPKIEDLGETGREYQDMEKGYGYWCDCP